MASPGCRRGQRGPRCSIHARRNLPDKAFGYLKRVRVTPGVYRPLAQLNPSFRYLHWPGFSDYTKDFSLAVTCVFIKQSGPPCHCDLRWQFYTTAAGIPYTKGTGLVCRVPSPTVYPIHLRLLIQRTCVGSRYEPTGISLRHLSWSLGVEQTQLTPSHSSLGRVLVITTLPNPQTVRQNDGSACPIRKQVTRL